MTFDQNSAIIKIFSYDFNDHKFVGSEEKKREMNSSYVEEPRVLKAEIIDENGLYFMAYIANNNIGAKSIGANSLNFDSL